MEKPKKTHKVFISYSSGGKEKKDKIDNFAKKLARHNIEAEVDIYTLKAGGDKFYFMEKIETDPKIDRVLVMCDQLYAKKADKREAGVGAECRIMSSRIYNNPSQTKIIPIVCQSDENGEPYKPVLLRDIVHIDFSSPKKEEENWDHLINCIRGIPEYVKPTLGEQPSHLERSKTVNTYDMESKFTSFKTAFLKDARAIPACRTDFFNACFSFIDSLRIRNKPDTDDFSAKLIDDFKNLEVARNFLVDWCLLESPLKNGDFSENLILVMEKLLELSSIPEDVNAYNKLWYSAPKSFAYECVLYFIAALMKTENYMAANELITSSYPLRKEDSYAEHNFSNITLFYYHSDDFTGSLPSADSLVKKNANRTDIPFKDIIQADIIITMFSFINPEITWNAQTLYYANFSYKPPFFIKATQQKGFKKLLTLTGFSNKEELTQKILEGMKKKDKRFSLKSSMYPSYDEILNIKNWDSVK